MSKLLSADFFRLRKSKLFWGMTVTVFLATVAVMLLETMLDAGRLSGRSLDYYHFKMPIYSGLLLVAFVSLFVGTEFTDDAIRNKIIVGHTKMSIYLSDLFTCFAAATAFSFAWVAGGLAGIPHFGLWNGGISAFLVKYMVFYCSVLSLTAIFNVLAHIFSKSKAGGAVFAMLFVIGLILSGYYFLGALYEPEFIYGDVTISVETGIRYGQEMKNPAYIGGSLRTVYKMLSYIFPPGQQLWLSDEECFAEQEPLVMMGISLIVSAVTTAIGCLFFRKKELK